MPDSPSPHAVARRRGLLIDAAMLGAALLLLAIAWRGDSAGPTDLGAAAQRAVQAHVGQAPPAEAVLAAD